MRSTYLLLGAALLASALTACGDETATAPPSTTAPSNGSSKGSGDTTWCAAITSKEPAADLADRVPAAHHDAAVASLAYLHGLESMMTASSGAKELAAALEGRGKQLRTFADVIASTCKATKPAAGIRTAATTADLVTPPAKADYCAALRPAMDPDAVKTSGPAAFASLGGAGSIAPPEHRDAVAAFAKFGGSTAEPKQADLQAIEATMMGLGLYAEARCDVTGAFAAMGVVAALLSMGGDGERNAGSIGTEPPAADVAAAAALVPSGSTLRFEAATVALDDSGKRKVSMPKPVGWTTDDFSGIKLEPPSGAGFSIFSEMSVDAGCDGTCEVTDWAKRLQGPKGFVTQWSASRAVTKQRVPVGSEGAVITTRSDDGDVAALVVRWDDTVDHYLRCEVDLDADDAAMLDALVAACEAARPNWFHVG